MRNNNNMKIWPCLVEPAMLASYTQFFSLRRLTLITCKHEIRRHLLGATREQESLSTSMRKSKTDPMQSKTLSNKVLCFKNNFYILPILNKEGSLCELRGFPWKWSCFSLHKM